MNPLQLELIFKGGAWLLDRFLTSKKPDEEIKPIEKPFDPSATMIQKAKSHAAKHAGERKISPAKSTLTTVVGMALYLAMSQGYLSAQSVTCMTEAAAEVQAKADAAKK